MAAAGGDEEEDPNRATADADTDTDDARWRRAIADDVNTRAGPAVLESLAIVAPPLRGVPGRNAAAAATPSRRPIVLSKDVAAISSIAQKPGRSMAGAGPTCCVDHE